MSKSSLILASLVVCLLAFLLYNIGTPRNAQMEEKALELPGDMIITSNPFTGNFVGNLGQGKFTNAAITFYPYRNSNEYVHFNFGQVFLLGPIVYVSAIKANEESSCSFIIRSALNKASGYYSFESVHSRGKYITLDIWRSNLIVEAYSNKQADAFSFQIIEGKMESGLSFIPHPGFAGANKIVVVTALNGLQLQKISNSVSQRQAATFYPVAPLKDYRNAIRVELKMNENNIQIVDEKPDIFMESKLENYVMKKGISQTFSYTRTVTQTTNFQIKLGFSLTVGASIGVGIDIKSIVTITPGFHIQSTFTSDFEYGRTHTETKTIHDSYTMTARKGQRVQAQLIVNKKRAEIAFEGYVHFDNGDKEWISGIYENVQAVDHRIVFTEY